MFYSVVLLCFDWFVKTGLSAEEFQEQGGEEEACEQSARKEYAKDHAKTIRNFASKT
jgi:hypothetical protein